MHGLTHPFIDCLRTWRCRSYAIGVGRVGAVGDASSVGEVSVSVGALCAQCCRG